MYSATIHVLMTGAGAPGAPGIIRCLQQDASIHLTVADADADATGKYLCQNFVPIPKAGDASFIPELLRLATENKIQVILPLVTRELFPLSAHLQLFSDAGVKVLVSSKESIQIANDKSKTYQHLQMQGIAVPQYRVVNTIDEFKSAATALGYPGEAICFKPSISNGSRGFRIISDQVDEFDLLFHHKPTSAYISYRDAVRILSAQSFPELLVTEYLPGDEYSVDCLCNGGEPVLVIPRLRKKIVNGISVQGEFRKDEAIISYCESIIRTLKLHGNIGIQLRRSKTGEPLLLEINPRVQGTIVSALGAGVNLPLLALKQAMGLPIADEELQVRWGTQFSRYWTEVYYGREM